MLYQSVLLMHLLAVAFGFSAAGALYVLRIRLAKSEDVREARAHLAASSSTAMLMPIVSVLLLVTGLVLTRMAWSFTTAWVLLAIAGVITMSVIGGGILKPRVAALQTALTAAPELTPELRERLCDPVGARAELTNIMLSFAIVVLMVLKPGAAAGVAIMLLLPLTGLVVHAKPSFLRLRKNEEA